MKKISVIIPMYNSMKYIGECLHSVIKQTYTNLEIIIINDNSTDESVEVIKKIMKFDERVKIFHLPSRRGVGAARNHGIEKATGDYIYFLDSDDYIPERTLELLIMHIKDQNLIRGKMRKTHFSSSFAVVFSGLFNIKYFEGNRFNLLRNNSATNYLFNRDYIIEKEFRFNEENKIYTDLYFMVPILNENENVPFLKEALYFYRNRNDSVLDPSLSQIDGEEKFNMFYKSYIELKSNYDNSLTQEFLDKQLLNFYRKDIIRLFKNKDNIEKYYSKLVQLINLVNPNIIKEYDYILKRELKAIKSDNLKRYIRVNKTHALLRNLKEGIKSRRKLYLFLYRNLFMKLSIKEDLVFFESFLGKNYSDSPKYIYEYMLGNNKEYKFVWSFTDKKEIPGSAKQVKRFSLQYFYYLARAKYWVSNSRLPKFLDKREGNVYLQTWHGTPLKKLVFDMDDIYSADPNYKKNFYEQSRRWDFLSSPNKYSSKIFESAFLFNKEMLEYGYPRNDILYTRNNKDDIQKLKKSMNIPLDKKVVLYAPTWRDDEFYSRGKYKFTLKLDLQKMQKELGEDYIVVLRMHYFIADALDLEEFKGFAYDFSKYDDIAELYLISDILITDYSSVFFDYANLKRPIIFFTYDLEKYRDTLRGFYLNIESEVPGPLLKESDEVIDAIKNIDYISEKYKITYDNFYDRFCKWDDGQAAAKTVERVFRRKV